MMKKRKFEVEEMNLKQIKNETIIFADGACSGNPGPGGWGSIICNSKGEVNELGGKAPHTTNNQMELNAVIEALLFLKKNNSTLKEEAISIYTDSTYVINGITKWIWGWMKNGWKTAEGKDVSNLEYWKTLLTLTKSFKINWRYVRGHNGIPGNERVDEIAQAFSKGKWLELYKGSLLNYSFAIYDIPENTEVPAPRKKEEKKSAYSYLSLVNGVLEKHKDWKSCEARVKGRPGAKFKKAVSEHNEKEILKEWGLSF